jgi:hypothetical protein
MKRAVVSLCTSLVLLAVLTVPGWGKGKFQDPDEQGVKRGGPPTAGVYYVPVQASGPASPGFSVVEAIVLLLGVSSTFLSIVALVEAKAAQRQARETRAQAGAKPLPQE